MPDRDAIQELFADFAWANDAHDYDLFERILADEMSFVLSIAGETAVGPLEPKSAVMGFFREALDAQTDTRRHVITNLRVLEDGGDSVRARAYLTLMVTDGGELTPTSTGRYDARLVRGDDGWRFASIDLALDRPF